MEKHKKSKKMVQFGVLALLLSGFTAMVVGFTLPGVMSVHAKPDMDGSLVSIQDPVFDWKFLSFFSQEKVCVVSTESASILASRYETDTKLVNINGDDVNVMVVEGSPLNKNILESVTGESLPSDCQVVHGNKFIAFLTPTIVS